MSIDIIRIWAAFQSEKTGSTPVGTANCFRPLFHSFEISEIACKQAALGGPHSSLVHSVGLPSEAMG
jgi:hypothetical protein